MIRFGMFNSINGDRRYKAEDFAQYFATFIGNGIFVKPSDCLQIYANGDSMSVTVRAGKAWVNGYYLINDDNYTLPLSVGDTTLNRIDRIVIRLDFVQRKMSVEVKKGALSASPIAPTLKRDADAYELALADVYIAKGALTINQAAITDTRLNNNLCGLMHGVVNQVDTTTIFNQYQQWFNDYSVTKAQEFLTWQTDVTTALENWIDAQEKGFEAWRQAEEQLYYTWLNGRKNEFDTWFATIKDILDSNAAGNLQLQIDNHLTASMPHEYFDTEANKVYKYGLQRNPELKAAAFVYSEKGQSTGNVINLPTYEQVQNMQTNIINTGGKIAGSNGKMYKAKMEDSFVFATAVGNGQPANFYEDLNAEYVTKYPSVAQYLSILSAIKHQINGSIFMSMNGPYIAFYDLTTHKIINCVYLPNFNDVKLVTTQGDNYLVDDKYVYIRCRDNNNFTALAVFDKNTCQFIKSITGTGSYTSWALDSLLTSGYQIPCLNGVFFTTQTAWRFTAAYEIIYDASGVPTGYTGNTQSGFPGDFRGRGVFTDGEYIYDIYVAHTSSWTMRKLSYNKSTKALTVVSQYTNTTAAPNGDASFSKIYKKMDINFMIVQWGVNGTLMVMRLDLMREYQQLFVGSFGPYPIYDYDDLSTLYTQSTNDGVGRIMLNGNSYENMYRFDLRGDGTYAVNTIKVPTRFQPPTNSSWASPLRAFRLSGDAIFSKGELYLKKDEQQMMKLQLTNVIESWMEA